MISLSTSESEVLIELGWLDELGCGVSLGSVAKEKSVGDGLDLN